MDRKIVIRWKSSDVLKFIDKIREMADQEREALGFLPKPAYQEAADQQKLMVAVDTSKSPEEYVGHLFFGGVFPHGRVFQLHVRRQYRRDGVGSRLVLATVRRLESEYYLSITANVAADLGEANSFWERMRFQIVRNKRGGPSRGRTINVRVRDLDTPSLLSFMRQPSKPVEQDLRLVDRLAARSPIYVIDLNVFFDVVKKRIRSKEAGSVIHAGLKNIVRVAVTEEFIGELRRSSESTQADPVLEFSLRLPQLAAPPREKMQEVLESLKAVVFPERTAADRLTIQDHSDLRHLVTAIHHKAAGFVTSEKAILRARDQLQSRFGIDVVGVLEFAELFRAADQHEMPVVQATTAGVQVNVTEIDDQQTASVKNFLENMYVTPQMRVDALAPDTVGHRRRRVLVRAEGEPIAFASWDAPDGPLHVTQLFMCADEDRSATASVLDYLFDWICKDVSRIGPGIVRLLELPGHSTTRRAALAHGFRSSQGSVAGGSTLQKVCVGGLVHAKNWGAIRLQLRNLAGIALPVQAPQICDPDDLVTIGSPSGGKVQITLKKLETLLSPVLFLFPARGGAIVPIRRGFAEDLFGGGPQLSLLTPPEAILLKERAYISGPNTVSILSEGTPLLFYESGQDRGRSSIIAAGRAVETRLVAKGEVDERIFRRGVLKPKTLERVSATGRVAVTTFDNIMLFENPVKLADLRKIGCVGGANLVTAQRVSARHLHEVFEMGKISGSSV